VEFARLYVPNVKVIIEELSEYSGLAITSKRIIKINARQSPNDNDFQAGLGLTALYGPTLKRPPKMSLNKTYFFILLHEIGHFKVKDKVPRYYAKVKRDIE